jgi:hypothetical protein
LVAAAGTLLIPSGPLEDRDRRHLHVVCTDPCDAGNQVIVPITSWTNDLCDNACILQANEHEFLKHKSYVLYRKARIEAASTLDNGIAQGLFVTRAPMNRQTFLRIKHGICRSKQTPRKVKKYFGCPVPGGEPR